MRVYVNIDRGEVMGIETRGVSGTQAECDEMIAAWKRQYGDDKVVVVHTEGKEAKDGR